MSAAALRGALRALGEGTDELHVFDLPQLRTKPSSADLLTALEWLRVSPRSWDVTPASRSGAATPHSFNSGSTAASSDPRSVHPRINPEGVSHYLTQIIANPLQWIHNDESREKIYTEASARLAERSGRTGTGDITRTFSVPIDVAVPTVDIQLHEPALTEDNLGLKTWASSFLLAKRLHLLQVYVPDNGPVLELGAGTGLVGIAAACVLRRGICLTDLPEIVGNLAKNVDLNRDLVTAYGGRATTTTLDWRAPLAAKLEYDTYPLILAADPLYSPAHPALFVEAIEARLKRTIDARVVVEIPIREGFSSEREDFRHKMVEAGLQNIFEDTESGFDDWEDEAGLLKEVQCWLSIWKWSP